MHYRCPVCHTPLINLNNGYTCQNKHHYDTARQGYVHLANNRKTLSGDNVEMVKARSAFLNKGYYQELRNRLSALIQQIQPTVLIDAGCGEGYYTNQFQITNPNVEIYGFDLSKAACKEAAKAHTSVHYAIASVHDMPVSDSCADACISVFAPIYIEEIIRVLKQGGTFIKVGPGPKHLWELKQLLYDDVYENKLKYISHTQMKWIHTELLKTKIVIEETSDVMTLFSMTPYAYRTPKEKIEKLKQIQELEIQLQFSIEIYQKAQE